LVIMDAIARLASDLHVHGDFDRLSSKLQRADAQRFFTSGG